MILISISKVWAQFFELFDNLATKVALGHNFLVSNPGVSFFCDARCDLLCPTFWQTNAASVAQNTFFNTTS